VRVLLDVNVLVRANERSRGPARTLLLTLIEKGHTLLTSRELLVELARVLRYPRLQALLKLTEEQIHAYVQFLRGICETVELEHSLPVSMRDPNDIYVLQTAVLGEADIICTLDRDFYAPETAIFCATLGIEVCSDTELAARTSAKS